LNYNARITLGVVYHDLGQNKIAMKFSQQSLAIQRQIGD
jgi:hypothetical protein